ncbi:MAG: hypothetical protein ACK559_36375 [bacterium]
MPALGAATAGIASGVVPGGGRSQAGGGAGATGCCGRGTVRYSGWHSKFRVLISVLSARQSRPDDPPAPHRPGCTGGGG